MQDFQKFYQVKKTGYKIKKFWNNKNKKLYQKFLEIVILFCIVISFITLIYSIGNIIFDVNFLKNHKIVSNIFLIIANYFYINLASIFCLLIVFVFCKNKVSLIITFISLISFFAIQNIFISNVDTNTIKILFFYITNKSITSQNLGIISLNIGPIGGVIFGFICTFFCNKYINKKLNTFFALMSGVPFLIFLLFIVSVVVSLFFIIFWIFLMFIIKKLYLLGSSNSYFYNFIYYFLFSCTDFLGFSKYLTYTFFTNNFITINDFIILFKKMATNYNFVYSKITDSWNNDSIQNLWSYLTNLQKTGNESFLLNEWILFLPVNSLPINNLYQTVDLFSWFKQPSFGNDYSVIFGFFIAFGAILVLTAKKSNFKPTIFIVSFMLLIIVLTGKTYALSLMMLFVSPLLYFGLYLPITILNSLLLNLLNIHLTSIVGLGLIDYISFCIIPSAKGTNFSWVLLFSFIWFIISVPVLYFVTVKKDLPFIGRTETIIPRITHRQIHEIFNH